MSFGLLDYFNDKAFILTLKKMKNWLKLNGEIIIGNFNENHNPSRDYMELFGEWFLNHRTEIKLKELAEKAGFKSENVRIGKEKENINLFLHIEMKEEN
jgi:extracellular factor (EF) 3-hydroxypalmitic acid methyl ester biosynthesis protein